MTQDAIFCHTTDESEQMRYILRGSQGLTLMQKKMLSRREERQWILPQPSSTRERHSSSLLFGEISRWCTIASLTVNFTYARACTITERMLKLGWGGKQERENALVCHFCSIRTPVNYTASSSSMHQQSPTKFSAIFCHLNVSKGWGPITSRL